MDDLLIKYLLGEASSEEIARVEQWLAEDAANKARYEQFKALWKIGRRTALSGPPTLQDTRAAFQQVRQGLRHRGNRVGLGRPAGIGNRAEARTGPMRIGGMRVGRLAAILTGALLLGAGIYSILRSHLRAPASIPVATTVRQAGGRAASSPGVIEQPPPFSSRGDWQPFIAGDIPRVDTLPDRSIVTLNRGASVVLLSAATDRGLSVRLCGEAFFRVVHDPSRPFVVEVNDVTIKVLGTSFEVKGVAGAASTGGIDGGASTELAVETGAVRVCRGSDSLVLYAGQRMTIAGRQGYRGAKKRWQKEPNRDKLYGYYLGRPLVCDSIPLSRLVEVLNEAYGAHLVIGRKELNDLPLTTVFRHEPLDRILAVIAATFDLTVVRQGQTIILQ